MKGAGRSRVGVDLGTDSGREPTDPPLPSLEAVRMTVGENLGAS